MHTIKGSGAMFGFDDIASFVHDVETVYDRVRNGRIPVTRHLVDLTLAACDRIRKMVDGEAGLPEADRKILDGFQEILGDVPPPSADPREAQPAASCAEGGKGLATYRIRFLPEEHLFATGTNPLRLLDELRDMGPCSVLLHTDRVPVLPELKPETCRLWWEIFLTTGQGTDAVRDVFIFVEDDCELTIETIAEEDEGFVEQDPKRLGEILVERGAVTRQQIEAALSAQKRLGELLVEAEAVQPADLDSALTEQQHVRQIRCDRGQADTIRVAAEKLDILVDLVGELVTVQASLSQAAGQSDSGDLTGIAEEVERLTAELRDNTMSIRMMPIGTIFNKFKRLVRDLSAELGKEVTFTTEGGETELDKTVIERLNDPLVHIIRNSIDHGIEAPAERLEKGKPAAGIIHLSAVHSGADVLIRISDDGAGLNADGIRRRALENGLIVPDADMTEKELFQLIFSPGFSTARQVTDISGRGVGMDVVKRGIEALRGSIDVESQPGAGTAISLKLPLTLAIIDGLLLAVADQHYVLPLTVVEECAEMTRALVEKSKGRNLLRIRNEIVPYIRLRDHFNIPGPSPPIEQIVITGMGGYPLGFVVDRIIGEHQTVIKSLSRVYRNARDFSGATILADGTVALILDVNRLAESAAMEEKRFQFNHTTH